MKWFGELVIPEFGYEDHPVAVAQKFQEIILETDDDTQAAAIAQAAIHATSSLRGAPAPEAGYYFSSAGVHLIDEPAEADDSPVWNMAMPETASMGGNPTGFHYLHTDKIRSLCLGLEGTTVFTTEDLRTHLFEYPESKIYLPVLAIQSVLSI